MTGLGIGVSGMKSGERALLRVCWELGYGEEGNFSFPNVPPKADISYEVELIGFDETKEGKARSDMTVEERIGAADRRKINGNALFKYEKLEEAIQQYEMAIAYMGYDFMFQLFGKYRHMALAVKNPCHLSTAMCLIKLKRYDEAVAQCSITENMAETGVMVGGAFLSGFLQVVFDRLASREVLNLFSNRKTNVDGLLKELKRKLLLLNTVLDDADVKQFTDTNVRAWSDEARDAVFQADDLLSEIAYEARRRQVESDPSSLGQVCRQVIK